LPKRIQWTYEAELDYIFELKKGNWIVGFLDNEGNPFECPTATNQRLVQKLQRFETSGFTGMLKVTVELNEKLNGKDKQYPILVDVERVRDSARGIAASVKSM
jgi:hypothetical protein